MSRAKKDWIQKAVKKPGGLHQSLHIPKGQKIPETKIEKAAHAKSPLVRKRANLALTLKKLSKKKV